MYSSTEPWTTQDRLVFGEDNQYIIDIKADWNKSRFKHNFFFVSTEGEETITTLYSSYDFFKSPSEKYMTVIVDTLLELAQKEDNNASALELVYLSELARAAIYDSYREMKNEMVRLTEQASEVDEQKQWN